MNVLAGIKGAHSLLSGVQAQPGEINGSPVDIFTLGHLGVGLALGGLRVKPTTALLVAVGWELAERPLKNRFPDLFPHPSQDTLANATGDVIAVMAGWWVAQRTLKLERGA